MATGTAFLNLVADLMAGRAVSAATVSVRAHSADPGTAGTTSRIGTVDEDVAAGDWTAAASGAIENSNDIEMGVLFTTGANQTVSHLSLWRGNTFMIGVPLASSVEVAANEEFTVEAQTVDLSAA